MNSITNLLDLEDTDLTISSIQIQGQTKTFFLETKPVAHFCPSCGFKMHSHGTKQPLTIPFIREENTSLPAGTAKNRIGPKAGIRRLPKTIPPSRTLLFHGSLTVRISLSTLRHGSKSFFMLSPYCRHSNTASSLTARLLYPAMALLSIPILPRMDISCLVPAMPFLRRNMPRSQDIIPTRMPHGTGTTTSIPFTSTILCSSFPATPLCCIPISRCCSALQAPNAMIPSLFLLLSMSWKNICLVFS